MWPVLKYFLQPLPGAPLQRWQFCSSKDGKSLSSQTRLAAKLPFLKAISSFMVDFSVSHVSFLGVINRTAGLFKTISLLCYTFSSPYSWALQNVAVPLTVASICICWTTCANPRLKGISYPRLPHEWSSRLLGETSRTKYQGEIGYPVLLGQTGHWCSTHGRSLGCFTQKLGFLKIKRCIHLSLNVSVSEAGSGRLHFET